MFSLARLFEAIATEIPERPAIISEDRSVTYGSLLERSKAFGAALQAEFGLGEVIEREHLKPWESGQDHLGICAFNCIEYVEAMLGAFFCRVAPFNINYRYVAAEMTYLLSYMGPKALCYNTRYSGVLLEALKGKDRPYLVALDKGDDALGGFIFEDLISAYLGKEPKAEPSPDDLYILCTGGTTGMPKGTLWRQADMYMAALGGIEGRDLKEVVKAAKDASPLKVYVIPPLMHAAAQWLTLRTLFEGNTVVLYKGDKGLDPTLVLATIEKEKPSVMLVVGDAFLKPITEAASSGSYDLSSVKLVATGGAFTSPHLKKRLLEYMTSAVVVDVGGASESGAHIVNLSDRSSVKGPVFDPDPTTVVINEAKTRVLSKDEEEVGWLARSRYVPLGYLGDEAKTKATVVEIDGVRYSMPGDRAQYVEGGKIRLLGRDSVTILTGGEKVFAEEVEQALTTHPAVADVVVTGVASERWGEEVTALVKLKDGASATAEELVAHASSSIARYKLPRRIFFVPQVVRSPAGKPDYRWAKAEAAKLAGKEVGDG